ncbi:unnamed protein product [Pedinophyceae sp. YPF-701]|nr:unnamed protein product [Pedinophyceae sp. YPF-701]
MGEENGNAGAIVPAGPAQASPAAGKRPAQQVVRTQTKAVGLIQPPPDIRAILDKTAQFVAKNGVAFEKRILEAERQNAKFQFLVPTSPYHAFYRHRVEEIQSGKDDAAKAAQAEAAKAASEPAKPAADQKEGDEQPEEEQQGGPEDGVVVTTKTLEKPDPELYTVHLPAGLTAFDVDLMKVTAQFTARNGKAFLEEVQRREANNPQFAFLKPTHSLFATFTQMADAYSRVLMPPKGVLERLKQDSADWSHVLERCVKRLEYEKALDRERVEADEAAQREREEMAAIDWHDFVVVETILFDDAEDESLPAPLSLQQVLMSRKAQEYDAGAGMEDAGAEEVEMEMDEEEAAMVAEGQRAEGAKRVAGQVVEAGDDEGPVRVVEGYKRERAEGPDAATRFVRSPLTGELIPVEDMENHMRVSLLDPRWKTQREAMLAKIRDSASASDEEIASNIAGLARTRPDIFGDRREEMSAAVQAALGERMTTGNQRAVAWDGTTTGGPGLKAQQAAIAQQRAEQPLPSLAAKGPDAPQVGVAMPPPPAKGEPPRKRQKQGEGE